MIKNKRGNIGIILFFTLMLAIIIIGFIASGAIAILGIGGDAINDVATSIGVVEDTNVSELSQNIVTPFNEVVQNLSWLAGVGYVCALIFSIVFVLGYRTTANPIFIGLFFIFVIFIFLASIVLSNSYEDMYSANDDIGARLRDQTILSYMILYSPAIVILISFISGIFLFAGKQNEFGGSTDV